MIVNIALWNDPSLFGDFGGEGRGYWNPFINSFLQWFGGQPLDRLPAWPLFETIVGALLVFGRCTTSSRSAAGADDVEADAVTGEATIG